MNVKKKYMLQISYVKKIQNETTNLENLYLNTLPITKKNYTIFCLLFDLPSSKHTYARHRGDSPQICTEVH